MSDLLTADVEAAVVSTAPGQQSAPIERMFGRILAVGAHPDDIELGCGGTLCRYRQRGSDIAFCVLTCGERGGDFEDRSMEARTAARLVGAELTFGDLPDTQVSEGQPTIEIVEGVIERFRPTAVFVNSPNDTHQDHRNAARAVISAARFVPIVLFYQTPSSTRDFTPTLYIDVSATLPDKLQAISIHASQSQRMYMSQEAVRGLAAFLGLQIYRGGKYFEGFEIHQMIL
ncbi:MAG TPA: PIG-L family deacetylase [Pirellulales bacterium]|nr:PIG-L family deacetylase [Pirellulales bacterium]